MIDKFESIDIDLSDGAPFLLVFASAYAGRRLFSEWRLVWIALTSFFSISLFYFMYRFMFFQEKTLANGQAMAVMAWACIICILIVGGFWR